MGERITRSLIIANTEHGLAWVRSALNALDYDTISWEEVNQPHMSAPCEKPYDYDYFWNVYRSEGYLAAQRFLGNHTLKGWFMSMIVFMLDRLHLLQPAKLILTIGKKRLGKLR